MFKQTLLPDTLRAIQLVGALPAIGRAYLAGGTALALQLGHRVSVDLDFFTRQKFKEQAVASQLARLTGFTESGRDWRTIWGAIGKTKFSFFYYQYPLVAQKVKFENIYLANKADIAAMKIHAIEGRGTKRDFIDVYFLSEEFSIEQMLSFYDRKYSALGDHLYAILRALDYFEDAEHESEMPQMLKKVDWEKVKAFFKKEVRRLTQEKLLSEAK